MKLKLNANGNLEGQGSDVSVTIGPNSILSATPAPGPNEHVETDLSDGSRSVVTIDDLRVTGLSFREGGRAIVSR